MAKRFFDTELWDKEWFGDLTIKQKALVFFLFAHCDFAGIYEPNYKLIQFYIGEKITENDILAIKQVVKLPNGKFFITDFIKFQYGAEIENLNERNTIQRGIIRLLIKNEIIEQDLEGNNIVKIETLTKGFKNSYERVQYKDKDKDKDKDISIISKKEKKIFGEFKNVLLTEDNLANLQELYKGKLNEAIETLSNYIASSGKKYKNHYAVLGKHNWVYAKVIGSKPITNSRSEILRMAGDTF